MPFMVFMVNKRPRESPLSLAIRAARPASQLLLCGLCGENCVEREAGGGTRDTILSVANLPRHRVFAPGSPGCGNILYVQVVAWLTGLLIVPTIRGLMRWWSSCRRKI